MRIFPSAYGNIAPEMISGFTIRNLYTTQGSTYFVILDENSEEYKEFKSITLVRMDTEEEFTLVVAGFGSYQQNKQLFTSNDIDKQIDVKIILNS